MKAIAKQWLRIVTDTLISKVKLLPSTWMIFQSKFSVINIVISFLRFIRIILSAKLKL